MKKTKNRRRRRLSWLGLVVVLVAGYVVWALRQPLPLISAVHPSTQLQLQAPASNLTWPATEQAAVGVLSTSYLETHGAQTSVPTASTAKLITALVVLQQKPLALNQTGPTLTMTAADAALYNSYVAQQGSVVPVAVGEQITQYQVLQAMLLPSANNMADSLASWGYGSLTAYAAAANTWLVQQGLSHTHVGSDASGFSPTTTSTASDLAKIGELAMQNPVLAQIVNQSSATLPLAGTVKNVNFLLGSHGIIGIKTGNTDQAGGVYVSASQTIINKHTVTLLTTVMGAPSLYQAMSTSLPLITSAQANFTPLDVISAGSIVGRYQLPWGGTLPATAQTSLSVPAWGGSSLNGTITLAPITTSAHSGQTVGHLTVKPSFITDQQSVKLILQGTPSQPPIWWRLLHP